MKISIKNLFLLFLLPFCLSCNSEDDDVKPVNFEEKIIGTWQLIDRKPNGIEYCELSTNIEFSQEGGFSLEAFMGDQSNECQSASISGTWSYLGDNKIGIDTPGIEETTKLIIDFFDSNTAFKLKEPDNTDQYEVYAKQ